jgi:predicted NAD/FAD-binding protein
MGRRKMRTKKTLAIVGGGSAGLSAAYHAKDAFEVTLFEKNDYLGGDALTFNLPSGPDQGLPLDLGFMVCNERTYPTFLDVASKLGVVFQPIEMSFSFSSSKGDEDYALNLQPGSSEPKKPSRFLIKMLPEIMRFCEQAERDHLEGTVGEETLREYMERHKISQTVRDYYVIPMAAAIWSAPAPKVADFPAKTYLRFYYNHGLLTLKNVPRWYSVKGGSKTYVEKIAALIPDIRLASGVQAARVLPDQVKVRCGQKESVFDYIVFALHGDQVLNVLENPSPELSRAFGVWQYETNKAVLHWDTKVLPKDPDHWASWNYFVEDEANLSLSCNYDLCNLQAHFAAKNRYILSLNRKGPIDPSKVIREFSFEHPVFNAKSVASQGVIKDSNGRSRAAFAGAYLGNGFHEDGFLSGKLAIESLWGLL